MFDRDASLDAVCPSSGRGSSLLTGDFLGCSSSALAAWHCSLRSRVCCCLRCWSTLLLDVVVKFQLFDSPWFPGVLLLLYLWLSG